ncbi:pirin family protein [Microbulbifer flavimaris]|uniref:Pirin family protein n=1 Tax=Microbulbifer flavimaris TaxID=1781068 RepID=A0ABX4HZU8_9GAMM|nr:MULTISPECIES: pirin family protein [Microbulbifer]KUJ83487.1 pirin [Microbulbifer sp. ZGT114]PCO05647.1 pirin family protein [Microbulbifer flavimaris]
MDYIRRAGERGRANFGWLESRHSFSFGSYFDPRHMGVSALRVINDDRVRGGGGFPAHGHRDMEIISYVLEGAIEHRDSTGNRYVVPAGEVQRMSAGRGIKHSEYNSSRKENLRFLQIWIEPNVTGIEPGYEQARIQQQGPLTALVTADGRDGSLSMHQDASLSRLRLAPGEEFTLETGGRTGYLHLIDGGARIGGDTFSEGDGIGFITTREQSVIAGSDGVEALWFDLPKNG